MRRPRALDLFCGAGGVSRGLQLAGFDVTGVDLDPAVGRGYARGPGKRGAVFVQADALTYPLDGFDLVCASPPCQKYTSLARLHPDRVHPDLVAPVRTRLEERGGFWAIENVPGAPLLHPILLCGSMFGLLVQRHRLFETSFFLMTPVCNHEVWGWGLPVSASNAKRGRTRRRTFGVYGGGGNLSSGNMEDWKRAMGIDWMSRGDISQAIPPEYSRFIGLAALAAMGWPL